MSIDAKIRDVEETPEGYLLHLEPRWEPNYRDWSCCGQSQLLIINPTWKPEPGLAIWGGGETVLIEVKPKAKQYFRNGYTKLYERFNGENIDRLILSIEKQEKAKREQLTH